jgi:hypothetical protein
MDQWHGNRTSIQNQIPTRATKSWQEDVVPSTPTPSTQTTTIFAPSTHDKKKKNQDKLENLL